MAKKSTNKKTVNPIVGVNFLGGTVEIKNAYDTKVFARHVGGGNSVFNYYTVPPNRKFVIKQIYKPEDGEPPTSSLQILDQSGRKIFVINATGLGALQDNLLGSEFLELIPGDTINLEIIDFGAGSPVLSFVIIGVETDYFVG